MSSKLALLYDGIGRVGFCYKLNELLRSMEIRLVKIWEKIEEKGENPENCFILALLYNIIGRVGWWKSSFGK